MEKVREWGSDRRIFSKIIDTGAGVGVPWRRAGCRGIDNVTAMPAEGDDDMDARPQIVVGIDGSEDSKAALRWAVKHARLIGGAVEAVAAREMDVAALIGPIETEHDYETEAKRRLDTELAEVLGDSVDVPISVKVSEDRPGRVLTEVADGAELLVIGSHGQGELPGLHLGSTANYCVHNAPCPVVVVRS